MSEMDQVGETLLDPEMNFKFTLSLKGSVNFLVN